MADVASFGGGVTIDSRVYLTDIGGKPIDDISDQVLDCTVQWNQDLSGGTAMKVDFSMKERLAPLAAQNTFVSPEITYRWGDGTIRRTRLGVFVLNLPKKEIDAGVVATYTGKDLTWVLRNSVLFGTLNFPAGTNYGEALEQVLRDAGFTNLNVRRTTRTMSDGFTRRRGKNRAEVANALAGSIGWYNIYMDLNGALTTLPYRDWSQVAPVGVIGPRVVVGSITATPAAETVPNTVMAKMQRSGQQEIVRYAYNRDPDSPISIQNMNPPGRHIVYEVSDSNVKTIADLEALAAKTLRDMGSFGQTYVCKLKPDPSWLGIQRTVDLDPALIVNGEPRAGRYHIKGWKVGTSPETALVELTFGKTVDYVEVAA